MCIGAYVETDLVDFVDFIHRLTRQTKVGHLTYLVLGHQDVTSSQILHKLNSTKGYKKMMIRKFTLENGDNSIDGDHTKVYV